MLNEQITKLSPTSKIFMAGSIVILVAFAAYNWTVAPQASYLKAAKAHEGMLANASKKTTVINERVNANKERIAKLREEINQIRDSFFTQEKAREFFSDLEPLSGQCDCTIDALNFTASEPVVVEHENEKENKKEKVYSSGIVTRGATLSLGGGYEGIVTFLKRLSSYTQRIVIEDLYIESIDPDSDILSCYMNIKIYIIENKESITDE